MPPGKKRKRTEDDIDDEPSYGLRQILPIANLPADFNGEPMDGMQYLFTVRRDARRLPNITRVMNPYEGTPPSLAPGIAHTSDEAVKPYSTPDIELPSEEWRAVFERRFRNFRTNILQPTTSPLPPPQRKLYPDKKDRDAWWAFLSGAPESVWNPPRTAKQGKQRRQRGPTFGRGGTIQLDSMDPSLAAAGWEVVPPGESVFSSGSRENFASGSATQMTGNPADSSSRLLEPEASPTDEPWKPREPTPLLMRFIDHRTSLHILMYFTHWFNIHLDAIKSTGPAFGVTHTPLDAHFRWIFALLSRVDAFCTADEISSLRALVRVCLALMFTNRGSCASSDDHASESDIASTPGADDGEDDPKLTIEGEETKTGITADLSSVEVKDKPRETMESSAWIILCAVADHWGQRDLWYDADELLKKIV